MPVIEIHEESPLKTEIRRVIGEADAHAMSLYAAESNHLVSPEDLVTQGARFFVARADGVAVGCAALLRDGAEGELKRMFVLERARGIGVGKALLQAVEDAAREDGVTVLRLESGIHNTEALALYHRAGYVSRGPFGAYQPDPVSVFMEKGL